MEANVRCKKELERLLPWMGQRKDTTHRGLLSKSIPYENINEWA